MSLLMDALKRAEEAKRHSPQGTDPGALSLEPRADDKSPLPDLSSHIDSVDADLQAEAARHATPKETKAAPTPEPDPVIQQREAARQVFTAKTSATLPLEEKPKSRVLPIIAVGTVACLAVTGYFGYQYLALTENSNRLVPTGPLAVAPPPRPITPPPPSPSPAPLEKAEAARPASAAMEVAGKPAAPEKIEPARAKPPRRPASTSSTPQSVGPGTQRIEVTARLSALDAALAKGYAALNRGDFAMAQVAYQDALREDPRQVDALLGLSAIAAHRGDADAAGAGYLRILEIDPRNPAALVGLMGLGATGDVAQRESRLRSLLAIQPAGSYEAGMLQFGLGNLYSQQRRWNEAQQAFFGAHSSDPQNPDYLYNLAVSLDHLQKAPLALRYYQSALAAVGSRPASFDRPLIEARIRELER